MKITKWVEFSTETEVMIDVDGKTKWVRDDLDELLAKVAP